MDCQCLIDWITFPIALLGFVITYVQLKRNVKEKSISNVIEIKKQLKEYDIIFSRLLLNNDNELPGELVDIYSYLGLFEVINIMIKNKLLSKEEYKTFFQYRIIQIFQNNQIREIIFQTPSDWKDLIELNKLINL